MQQEKKSFSQGPHYTYHSIHLYIYLYLKLTQHLHFKRDNNYMINLLLRHNEN